MPNDFDVPGFGNTPEEITPAQTEPFIQRDPVATSPQVERVAAPVDLLEEFKRTLPKGLKKSIELLQEIERFQVNTRDEQRQKSELMKIINAHVFALQQTPAAPPVTGDEKALPDSRVEGFLQRIHKAAQEAGIQ